MDLVRPADACVGLSRQRDNCALPEVDAVWDAELAQGLVPQLFNQRRNALEGVDQRAEVDSDIDDRFGGQAWNGSAPHVLDIRRPLADGRLEAGALLLEKAGPARIVVREND